MRRTGAFTLIELLVAVAVLSVVLIYLLQSFSAQHRTYVVVDQVSEVQQNIQAVGALIESDVRGSGYMVPEHAAVCGWDDQNGPDTLFVSNPDVILAADQLAAATGNPSMAAARLGAPVSGAGAGWTPPATLNLAQDFVDVAPGPDFAQNAGVILVDRNDPDGRAACGIITNANPTTTLEVDWGGTSITAVSSEVLAIPAHVYRVNTPVGAPAQLLRNGLVLAHDVEDLQLAYFFDADGDRNVDAGEYAGDGVAPNADYDPALVDGATLREVRLNLVMLTRDPDPRQGYAQGMGQSTENRNPASLPAQDGLRRRVHTATVWLRNVGNS